jgi:2-aminoadipate transaminase
MNTLEFFDKALAQKVAFVPGASFYANGEKEGLQTLRVNFSYSGPEKIEPGMKVLGNTLKEELVKK